MGVFARLCNNLDGRVFWHYCVPSRLQSLRTAARARGINFKHMCISPGPHVPLRLNAVNPRYINDLGLTNLILYRSSRSAESQCGVRRDGQPVRAGFFPPRTSSAASISEMNRDRILDVPP
jgi:hypothetical protein